MSLFPLGGAVKNGSSCRRVKQGMESKIRQCVCAWYGVRTMRVEIQSLEDEIAEFKTVHSYIPADWWSVVNHASRQVLLWAKQTNDCFDFVVEDKGEIRMIQDVCFKDAYPSVGEWYVAIQQVLQDPVRKVWIVRHE